MIWTSSRVEIKRRTTNTSMCKESYSRRISFPVHISVFYDRFDRIVESKDNTASAAEARRMNIPLSSLRVPQTHHHVSLFRASGHSDGSICVDGLPRSRNGKDLHIINKIGSSDAVCALQFGPSRWIPSLVMMFELLGYL